jgi:hypothetical protein
LIPSSNSSDPIKNHSIFGFPSFESVFTTLFD